MTKFRINDTVRITHSPCRYFDMMGTVSDIAADLPSGPPLYARDLEALVHETQAEAVPTGAASDVEGENCA